MSNLKQKIKNSLFDIKAEEIFDSVLKDATDIQENLDIIKINKEQLDILKNETAESIKILDSIKKNRNRRTAHGKLTVQELQNIAVRSKRTIELLKIGSSHNEIEYVQATTQIYDFLDKIRTTFTRLDNLPYPNAGITVVGYLFTVIPFLNILSIVFGGYLGLSNDRRCQINGLLMIVIVILVVLFSLLI